MDVETGEGHRRFGRFAGQSVWAPPDPKIVAPQSLLVTLAEAYHAMVDPLRPPSVYGVSRRRSRGVSWSRRRGRRRRIQPALSPCRASAQRLGADIEIMPVGWRTASARRVTVRLVRDNGAVLARAQACLGDGTDLRVPRGALRPGDRLTLLVGSASGPGFAYPILVVPPATLPRPDGPVSQPWMIAAWRFANGEDLRLDSLARLRIGGRTSYAARRLLDAILTDEQPS